MPESDYTRCEPWLLWLTPEHCSPCHRRPRPWWRAWQWLLLGWRWTPNPRCPLPGHARPARPPADEPEPRWTTLTRTDLPGVLRAA